MRGYYLAIFIVISKICIMGLIPSAVGLMVLSLMQEAYFNLVDYMIVLLVTFAANLVTVLYLLFREDELFVLSYTELEIFVVSVIGYLVYNSLEAGLVVCVTVWMFSLPVYRIANALVATRSL